jgi:hypothetical protein
MKQSILHTYRSIEVTAIPVPFLVLKNYTRASPVVLTYGGIVGA